MDKPKCRLCGAKHLLSEPHEFQVSSSVRVKTKDEGTARSLAARAGSERRARTAVKPLLNPAGYQRALTGAERMAKWRKEHPEENRTYMRNYMREYRRRQAP
jgi:hypothetical protein